MQITISQSKVTISEKSRLLQQLDEIDQDRKKLLANYRKHVADLNMKIQAADKKYDADVLDLNLKATAITAQIGRL
jgi:hypothetical protein